MKVWMTARATGNPYMTLLTEHLGQRGVDLRATPRQHDISLDLVRHGRPDILHVHWLYDFFLRGKPSESLASRAWAKLLARWFVGLLDGLGRRGTGIVWTAHNAHNHELRKPDIDRYCYEAIAARSDAILAHSPTAKALLVDEFAIADPDKVHVVYHGHYIGAYPDEVDARQARQALGIDDDRLVFTFFGRVRPYKNVPLLIDAFDRLVDREGLAGEALLVIAGKPSPEEHDAEIRRCIGRRDDVRLVAEFIDDADVQLYMRAADVVVLPYQEILTSGSAVLAMSFGRPVVAPRLGTLRDVLSQQDDLLYPVDGGCGPLVDAMARAASLGRQRLEALGQANLERAREWDWPGVARDVHAVYERVIEAKRRHF